MFEAFFPRPKLLFTSCTIWTLWCILLWFLTGQHVAYLLEVIQESTFSFGLSADFMRFLLESSESFGAYMGEALSVGPYFGYAPLDYDRLYALVAGASSPEVQAEIEALQSAATFWSYQYNVSCYVLFAGTWYVLSNHEWKGWALLGSASTVFIVWFLVQLDVMINNWFGDFYDMIQNLFKAPGSIGSDEYYGRLSTFFYIAAVVIIVKVFNNFFVQHYVFRWRTALNERYTKHWNKIKHIEGADQRVQDDTMRFASITQDLGIGFIDAVMTLIAFLPILWTLSRFVSEIPIIGPVSQGLVIVSIAWSIIGTIILFISGRPLVGFYFLNQRVEAAYRAELVLGRRDANRASPPKLRELFADVRTNYFRLYMAYMYFNIVRYSYLQAGVLVPYIALAPSLLSAETVAAGFTLGVMQQTIRAFGRVESSFQFLVLNWSTIVEWQSIYKRIRALDAAINNEPLPKIDQQFLAKA